MIEMGGLSSQNVLGNAFDLIKKPGQESYGDGDVPLRLF